MHGKKNLGEEHNEKHTIEGAFDRGQCLMSLRPPKLPTLPRMPLQHFIRRVTAERIVLPVCTNKAIGIASGFGLSLGLKALIRSDI